MLVKRETVPKGTNILQYWAAKQFHYPILSKIARDYLAIRATSAASERVFSNGTDVLTKKRNKMATGTLRYVLCLRNWGVRPDSALEDEI